MVLISCYAEGSTMNATGQKKSRIINVTSIHCLPQEFFWTVLVFPLPQSHSNCTDILSSSSKLWNEDEDCAASVENVGRGIGTLAAAAHWPEKVSNSWMTDATISKQKHLNQTPLCEHKVTYKERKLICLSYLPCNLHLCIRDSLSTFRWEISEREYF